VETGFRQRDGTGQALNRPTIFARATGALPSAIAIVRISGAAAASALTALTRRSLPPPRRAVLRKLFDAQGDALDSAIVLWLPGPDTVTGDDVAELQLHGGRAVLAGVEAALAKLSGLHPAEAGAFTRRAFENGRIDLSQVEGLADLLGAETARQRTAALINAEGGLRRTIEAWQIALLSLSARAEAAIDFSDEADVDVSEGAAVGDLAADIAALAAEFDRTRADPPVERLRDGVRIGIAGPPNAGKSTLLNALVGREAAIASPIAGTTRDLVEVPVDLGGVPIVFVDMAGLRDATDDPVEAIGIGRAGSAIAQSDLVLWLGRPEDAPAGDHVVRISAKSDLVEGSGRDGVLAISAVSGFGMDNLRALIRARASAVLPAIGGLALSSAQHGHVSEAAAALHRAAALRDDVLCAEELRAALRALDRITGGADTEAMLDSLFGRFCIGK